MHRRKCQSYCRALAAAVRLSRQQPRRLSARRPSGWRAAAAGAGRLNSETLAGQGIVTVLRLAYYPHCLWAALSLRASHVALSSCLAGAAGPGARAASLCQAARATAAGGAGRRRGPGRGVRRQS